MLPLVISYPSTGLVGVGWPSTAFGGPGTGWPLAYSMCGIQPGVRVGFGSTDAAPPISVSWAFGSSTLLSLKRKHCPATMYLGVQEWGQGGARTSGYCPEAQSCLFQISLASRMPKDQGLCHVLEQVYSVLKQGS